MVSEYPALGVIPATGSVPLPTRTYTSFSSAAIETGISRYKQTVPSHAMLFARVLFEHLSLKLTRIYLIWEESCAAMTNLLSPMLLQLLSTLPSHCVHRERYAHAIFVHTHIQHQHCQAGYSMCPTLSCFRLSVCRCVHMSLTAHCVVKHNSLLCRCPCGALAIDDISVLCSAGCMLAFTLCMMSQMDALSATRFECFHSVQYMIKSHTSSL